MASGPILSWQIDGETMETVTDFIFLGSKITEDGDCSHEIKRHLLLGRKAMTNIDRKLKSRDITLLTKVHLVKAMVFPVVTYGCKELDDKEGLSDEELMLLNCGFVEDSSESLGLQYAMLFCPSPSPRACSHSCPSSQLCRLTISSSVVPFSSCLQSFPASGLFQ